MKNLPATKTITKTEEKPETPRRSDRKDALKRDILRVSTQIRAGGSADDDGNDL
jgi:hypothetical protein